MAVNIAGRTAAGTAAKSHPLCSWARVPSIHHKAEEQTQGLREQRRDAALRGVLREQSVQLGLQSVHHGDLSGSTLTETAQEPCGVPKLLHLPK